MREYEEQNENDENGFDENEEFEDETDESEYEYILPDEDYEPYDGEGIEDENEEFEENRNLQEELTGTPKDHSKMFSQTKERIKNFAKEQTPVLKKNVSNALTKTKEGVSKLAAVSREAGKEVLQKEKEYRERKRQERLANPQPEKEKKNPFGNMGFGGEPKFGFGFGSERNDIPQIGLGFGNGGMGFDIFKREETPDVNIGLGLKNPETGFNLGFGNAGFDVFGSKDRPIINIINMGNPSPVSFGFGNQGVGRGINLLSPRVNNNSDLDIFGQRTSNQNPKSKPKKKSKNSRKPKKANSKPKNSKKPKNQKSKRGKR